jgi:hypothetical protein
VKLPLIGRLGPSRSFSPLRASGELAVSPVDAAGSAH